MTLEEELSAIQEVLASIKSALESQGYNLDGIAPKDWANAINSQ